MVDQALSPLTAPLVDLSPVRFHIEQHFRSTIDLAALSQLAGYSPFHLIRQFKRQFRVTPHQYQIRQRITEAKRLLALTTDPVTEICLAVGFESLGTFSSRFLEITGWSPTVYRARVIAQNREPRQFIPACYRWYYRSPLGQR